MSSIKLNRNRYFESDKIKYVIKDINGKYYKKIEGDDVINKDDIEKGIKEIDISKYIKGETISPQSLLNLDAYGTKQTKVEFKIDGKNITSIEYGKDYEKISYTVIAEGFETITGDITDLKLRSNKKLPCEDVNPSKKPIKNKLVYKYKNYKEEYDTIKLNDSSSKIIQSDGEVRIDKCELDDTFTIIFSRNGLSVEKTIKITQSFITSDSCDTFDFNDILKPGYKVTVNGSTLGDGGIFTCAYTAIQCRIKAMDGSDQSGLKVTDTSGHFNVMSSIGAVSVGKNMDYINEQSCVVTITPKQEIGSYLPINITIKQDRRKIEKIELVPNNDKSKFDESDKNLIYCLGGEYKLIIDGADATGFNISFDNNYSFITYNNGVFSIQPYPTEGIDVSAKRNARFKISKEKDLLISDKVILNGLSINNSIPTILQKGVKFVIGGIPNEINSDEQEYEIKCPFDLELINDHNGNYRYENGWVKIKAVYAESTIKIPESITFRIVGTDYKKTLHIYRYYESFNVDIVNNDGISMSYEITNKTSQFDEGCRKYNFLANSQQSYKFNVTPKGLNKTINDIRFYCYESKNWKEKGLNTFINGLSVNKNGIDILKAYNPTSNKSFNYRIDATIDDTKVTFYIVLSIIA